MFMSIFVKFRILKKNQNRKCSNSKLFRFKIVQFSRCLDLKMLNFEMGTSFEIVQFLKIFKFKIVQIEKRSYLKKYIKYSDLNKFKMSYVKKVHLLKYARFRKKSNLKIVKFDSI
jgi:hypothetical protein